MLKEKISTYLKAKEEKIKEDKLSKGPKIVIIGGGTGLGNILKGIKEHTSNITAIVTTFDDRFFNR